MTRTALTSILTLLAAPTLLTLAPRFAGAAECTTDADCAKGTTCQVTAVSGCGYACPEGQTCPPPPDCTTTEYKECAPGPCAVDSDCGEGLVCVTTSYSVCSMQPCAAGTDCTSTCTEQTESRCAPPYVAPCTVDADCGDGFTCAQGQICGCAVTGGGTEPVPPSGVGGAASDTGSGGAATGTAGATGTGTAGAGSNCTCQDSGERYCQPNTYSCATTQDCPTGWTCDSNPVIEACPVSADGGVADCPTASGVADRICVPPYWGGTVSLGFAQGSADLGTEPAKAYVPTAGGAAESKDSGGCQFAPGGKQSGLGTLFGLGALALGFSRRRRGATA